MSQNLIADLEEFTKEMAKHDERQVIKDKPECPHTEIVNLRVTLIEEEIAETIDAMYELNGINTSMEGKYADRQKKELFAAVADGIADSIVVLIGTALAYGIPLQKVWNEVHRSNMDKVTRLCPECRGHAVDSFDMGCASCGRTGRIPITPNKRSDGKILKPDGWQPPKIKEIIEEAMK